MKVAETPSFNIAVIQASPVKKGNKFNYIPNPINSSGKKKPDSETSLFKQSDVPESIMEESEVD
jgi:hypothetical protein